ncbi:Uncharacterised protein [Mycobacteroides abscessus subsp. abscessus]|nr:Uncharacterised protein [Mycobacteroides abscessus subsp. abscessus]
MIKHQDFRGPAPGHGLQQPYSRRLRIAQTWRYGDGAVGLIENDPLAGACGQHIQIGEHPLQIGGAVPR